MGGGQLEKNLKVVREQAVGISGGKAIEGGR